MLSFYFYGLNIHQAQCITFLLLLCLLVQFDITVRMPFVRPEICVPLAIYGARRYPVRMHRQYLAVLLPT